MKRVTDINLDDGDLEGIVVDINKNFNLLGAFGSIPIVVVMEQYIYETVFPALTNFFDLKLPIKPKEREFFNRFLEVIMKSVSFCKKPIHYQNSDKLFKMIRKTPQLKESNGDTISNKALTTWLKGNDNSKKAS